MFALSTMMVMAQNINVTGTVVSGDDNQPIIGAYIVEQGTKNGTVSDMDGHFSISVPSNATLSISYIGYSAQKVAVNGQRSLSVKLSNDVKQLNDVVVIGYGTQKKADLSSSIAVLDSKEITKVPGGLSAGLQSEVPGVQVTNGRIHIRGVGSINNTDPLYVVDGMIGGAIPDENDIATIQVLKDAASCAIYGARGANGVIVITTKRAKPGEVKVDYNGYVGWKTFTNQIDLLSGKDLAELINEEMYNADPTRTDYMKGLSDPESIGKGYNMFDAIKRTGFYQKHNIAISGGNEDAKFKVSGIYSSDKPMFIHENYQDYSMNFLSDFKKGIFTFGETATVSHNLHHWNEELKLLALKWSTCCPIYDATSSTGYAGAGLGTDMANSRATADYTWDRSTANSITGNAWVTAEPIKGLVYKFNFGADIYRYNYRSYIADYTVGVYQSNTPDTYSMGNTRTNRFLYEHTLSYDTSIGLHHINAMVGITSEETKGFGLTASARAMPSSEVLILGASQDANSKSVGSSESHSSMYSYLARLLYTYGDRYMFTANFRRDGSSNFSKNNRYGNFPSFSAAWRVTQEMFMKDVTWLNDLKLRGSWGKIGNSNINPYQYQSTVSFSNVRYYFNDTENTGAMPLTPSNPDVKWETSTSTDFGLDMTVLNNTLSVTADYYYNKTKDMLVEVPISYAAGYMTAFPTLNAGSIRNKGFEIVLNYRNHIGNNFDYSIFGNLSTVDNKVLDLGANNEIFAASGVTCTKVGSSIGQFWGYKTNGLYKTQAELDADKSFATKAALGDVRFVDINNDGKLNSEDMTFIGNPIPDFSYGFGMNASYRTAYGTFDFSMVWNGSVGNDIYNNTRYYGEGMWHNYSCFASTLNRYRAEDLTFTNPVSGVTTFYPKNTDTNIPRAVYGDPNQNMRQSDRYVESGTYLRLKSLVFGYTLPAEWAKKVYAENIRCYVGGKNIITITPYSGFDPEVGDQNTSGTNLTRGVDGLTSWDSTFPNSKEIYLGLQVTF
jgi:TonB-linked SusC/RagA family outer membrane protein